MSKNVHIYKRIQIPSSLVPNEEELNSFCSKNLQLCLNQGNGIASCITQVNSKLLHSYGQSSLNRKPYLNTTNEYKDIFHN